MLSSMTTNFPNPSVSTVHRAISTKTANPKRVGSSRVQAMDPQRVPIPLAPLTAPERTSLVQAIVRREASPLQLQICDAPAVADRVEKAAIPGGLRKLESEYRWAGEKLQRAADPSVQRLEATIRNGTIAGATLGGLSALCIFSKITGLQGGPRDFANRPGLILAMMGAGIGAGMAYPVTFLWATLAHALKLL